MRLSKLLKTSQRQQALTPYGPTGDHKPRINSKKALSATERAPSNTRRKHRLEGFFMALPLDIFIQILNYSCPSDLLALARTTKSCRRFLMSRSALRLWQQAECNLSEMGLPRCPPHLVEPQYAALLFTKICTICGAKASRQADLYLYVRLCSSCCNTELIDIGQFLTQISNLIPCSPTAGPQTDKTELSYYCLRDEARKLDAQRSKIKASGDVAVLEAWDYEHDQALENRLKHGVEVYTFLRQWDYDKKTRRVMRERREAIEKRANDLELEWSRWCKNIHYSLAVLWYTLTEQPKPLTENAWKTLLPTIKLTLIHGGQLSHQAQDKKARRECSRRLGELWLETGANPGRLGPIATALGVGTMPSSSEISNEMRRVVLTPFPNVKDGLKWDCMEDLRWARYDEGETGEVFASILDQINAKVPEWVDQVESQLVGLVSRGAPKKRVNDSVALTVRGSTESTAHLSDTTRRILRADCVFKASKEHPLFGMLHDGSDSVVPISLFYPDLLITRRDEKWDPTCFQAYPDASRVAKGLLECLGMQDAAHMELKVMGRRFVCRRCSDQKARDWSGIIGHYIEEQRRHKRARGTNHHDLGQITEEPAVQISPVEAVGDEPDLAKIVPPPKPLRGEREYRSPIDAKDPCDYCYRGESLAYIVSSL
ncbi:hypothetical protein FRC08_004306 [Ceratobasidium sp. 394]|nr:hypothetical protein FRC08_004306 [Ceratobasidium sp. 394]